MLRRWLETALSPLACNPFLSYPSPILNICGFRETRGVSIRIYILGICLAEVARIFLGPGLSWAYARPSSAVAPPTFGPHRPQAQRLLVEGRLAYAPPHLGPWPQKALVLVAELKLIELKAAGLQPHGG